MLFIRRILKTILITGIFVGLAASILPLETSASGPMCTLSCCAGRAPHAAGSCMNGACHAFLIHRAGQSHVHHSESTPEQFCGLTILSAHLRSSTLRGIDANRVLEGKDSQTHSKESVSAGTIGRPCEPNCGAGLLRSSSQTRRRHSGVIARAANPRPPSRSDRLSARFSGAKSLNRFAQISPRGPPNPSA